MTRHTCRRGGYPVGLVETPAWATPGSLVKLADQEHWRRVTMLWLCCHTYEVAVEASGDQEAGTPSFPPDALEDLWAAYPSRMPPDDYPLPPRPGIKAFRTGKARRVIQSLERLRNSPSGNPRYVITFEDGSSAVTKTDGAYVNAVGSLGMRPGAAVIVTYTRAGRIAAMVPEDA